MKVEKTKDGKKLSAIKEKGEHSELVIREVMLQKGVGRADAIKLLDNPPQPNPEDPR